MTLQVPADGCVLEVKGLQPNAEYVFAVAAYDEQGNLLGPQTAQPLRRPSGQTGQLLGHPSSGSIGQTGRPIVSCHSLPLLLAYGYCCQVHTCIYTYCTCVLTYM